MRPLHHRSPSPARVLIAGVLALAPWLPTGCAVNNGERVHADARYRGDGDLKTLRELNASREPRAARDREEEPDALTLREYGDFASGSSSSSSSSSLTGGGSAGTLANGRPFDPNDPSLPLMVENPDGSVTLNAYLPMHLIGHLQTMLAQERYDVIEEQLIAESARAAYRSRNRDPHEIITFLEGNRVPVLQMLARMPYGINSPSVIYNQAGTRMILRVHGPASQDLQYTTLEVNRENGQFRLHSVY